MKLIAGLGNPGKEYEKTRHNIGFKVIDELSKRFHIHLNQTKFRGVYGTGIVRGEKVMLLKPLTYMNLSGEAIAPMLNYYKIPLSDFLLIYDELDLPVGKLRLRYKGSAGGHNGLRSVITHLGTEEFNRIRIGIDRPNPGYAAADYVLGKFSNEEQQVIDQMILKSADACEMWLEKPFIEVMNKYN